MPRRRRLPSSSRSDGGRLQVAPRPSEVSCTPRPGSVPTTMAEIGRTQRARAAWSQAGSERVRTRRERQLGGSPGADDLVRRCALTDLLGEFMQRGSAPVGADLAIAGQFGSCDATMHSAALSYELSAIDEPHNGHSTDAEEVGGLLSADKCFGRQYHRLRVRLQHIDESKERVTSRIRNVW